MLVPKPNSETLLFINVLRTPGGWALSGTAPQMYVVMYARAECSGALTCTLAETINMHVSTD